MSYPPLSVSQNFLTNRTLVERLVDETSIRAGDTVVDIGAGKGIITAALANRACRVVAIELDPVLARGLRASFAHCPNVTVLQGDALRVPLPAAPYKVFANIPFARTADIVRRLTTGPHSPADAYLAMQAEAADRFTGRPKGTLAAAVLASAFDTSVVHRFRASDFAPRPSVGVVLLRLEKRGPPPTQEYRDFVTACFTAWAPNLREALRRLGGTQVANRILAEANVPMDVRPSDLEPTAWLDIFRAAQPFARVRESVRGRAAEVQSRHRRRHVSHRTRRPPPAVQLAAANPVAGGSSCNAERRPRDEQVASIAWHLADPRLQEGKLWL